MHPMKRMSWTIWTMGVVVVAAFFFAGNATANDDHRSRHGDRINHHLDFLAVVAALSSDAVLAATLDLERNRIAHRYDRDTGHHVNHWRRSARKHHRHSEGCGHSSIRHLFSHGLHAWRNSHYDRHDRHDRYDRHSRHNQKKRHDDRRHKRRHKRHHRN